jgi:hypothetical protein
MTIGEFLELPRDERTADKAVKLTGDGYAQAIQESAVKLSENLNFSKPNQWRYYTQYSSGACLWAFVSDPNATILF